jgi:hypothetical protein
MSGPKLIQANNEIMAHKEKRAVSATPLTNQPSSALST